MESPPNAPGLPTRDKHRQISVKWVKACDNIVLGRDGALILPETVRLPGAWGDPGECSLRVKEVIHSRNIFCVIQRTVVATASS